MKSTLGQFTSISNHINPMLLEQGSTVH
uniref:Uncharacterized protein n=1 Tax=Anguilla anguilla TaxID=7936 RepID=A0A0E9P5M8_ANGAN